MTLAIMSTHQEGNAPTPARYSNTSPEITIRLKVAIDWLTVTFSENMTRELMEAWLLGLVPGEFTEAGHGIDGYESMSVGPGGAKVLWTVKNNTIRVVLPGTWCRAVELPEMKMLLQNIIEAEGEFKRIDLAADDYEYDYTVQEVYERSIKGELVTHAQRKNWTLLQNAEGGCTFMVGSRRSRQILRLYDKNAESAGLINAMRWEIESKREAATSLAAAIILSENLGEVWASRLVGIADFRIRDDSNTTRRNRCPWFTNLVRNAVKARAYPVQPVKLLTQVQSWLERQIACSLALVVQANKDGWNWLANIIESGEVRWKPRHKIMLAQGGIQREAVPV